MKINWERVIWLKQKISCMRLDVQIEFVQLIECEGIIEINYFPFLKSTKLSPSTCANSPY